MKNRIRNRSESQNQQSAKKRDGLNESEKRSTVEAKHRINGRREKTESTVEAKGRIGSWVRYRIGSYGVRQDRLSGRKVGSSCSRER